MSDDLLKSEKVSDYLCDPTDPTGTQLICKSSDEIDSMLDAMALDERLPRIIYLRRKRKTIRQTANIMGISKSSVDRILKKGTRKLLRRCGLRNF